MKLALIAYQRRVVLAQLVNRHSDMAYYAAALIVMKGAAFITLPFMAKYLLPEQLGMLELLGVSSLFICLISGLAMHECLYRFIATIKHSQQRFEAASQLYSLSIFSSVAIGIVMFLISETLPSGLVPFSLHQRLLILLVACYETPMAICLAWLRLHDQASLFFKLVMITTLAQVFVLTAALFNGAGVTTLFTINLLSTLAQFLFLHLYLKFQLTLPAVGQMKIYLVYSSPIMLSAVVAFGLSGAERWILVLAEDLHTLGMYAIAAKFGLALGILIQPFHMWWMPKRFSYLESDSVQVTQITQYGVLLTCTLAVVTHALGQAAVLWLLPEHYHTAIDYIWLTLVIMLLKEASELLNLGVLYAKKTHQLLVINIIATLVALLACFSSYSMGINAVLLSLALGQFTKLILIYWLSQTHLVLPFKTVGLFCLISATMTMLYLGNHYHASLNAIPMVCLQVSLLICIAAVTKLIPISLSSFKSRCAFLNRGIG